MRTNALQDNSVKNKIHDNIIETNVLLRVGEKVLVEETNFVIARGKKYGLIGNNGCGKSSLLKHLDATCTKHDVYYVDQEMKLDVQNMSLTQIILDANVKRRAIVERLGQLNSNGLHTDEDVAEYKLLNEEVIANEYDKDEAYVRKILYGLGFDREKQEQNVQILSGGWKMRPRICWLANKSGAPGFRSHAI